MQKPWRCASLQLFPLRRRRVLLAVLLLAALLGALAAGAGRMVVRPALAQEATRIPVFPTATRAATRAVTPTAAITATLTATITTTATPTPEPTIELFVPIVPGSSEAEPLYLPLITSQQATSTPTPIVPAALPTQRRMAQSISGLLGAIERNPAGGEQLLITGGSLYALVPATTELDAQLTELGRRAPLDVRVSGTLYTTGSGDANAFLVVTAIVAIEDETPTSTPAPPTATPSPTALVPTPTATPGRPPAAVGRFDAVNLRTGPGEDYSRIGQILLNQRCALVGRNAGASWVQLECQGTVGWVEPRLVTLDGDAMVAPVVEVAVPTPTPTPTATPQPTATPYTFLGWRTLYFANTTLAGVPAAVDDLPTLDLNWGTGAARAGLPADAFSVRFERVIDFAPGFYFFSAEADDGIRVYIDGQTMIDALGGAGGMAYRFGSELGGLHTVRVEFVEYSGAAQVRLTWAQAPANRWTAAYSGLPVVSGGVLSRMEPDGGDYALDYMWGNGSPTGPYTGAWMAQWEARYTFLGGDYLFWAQADDGVRLYLDNLLLLDKWSDGAGEVRNRFLNVGGGEHVVRVEYYQRTGIARVRVWWGRTMPGAIEPR